MDQSHASTELTDVQQSDASQYEIFGNSLDSVGNLYRDSKTADVHFKFESSNNGTATQIDAHKNLLAATSDVFGAMFYGELKETGDIRVVDVSDAAFKEFLQYFYQRKVKLSAENISEVMYLGHKYNVKKCVEDCITFMKRTLNNENVCTAFYYANLYGHPELVELCRKRMMSNTEEIFNTPGFLKCDRQVLENILCLSFLSCPEDKVFEACMTWVKAKTQLDVLSKEIVDEHLGYLFHWIHFASMTMQQLCALQKKYDLVLSNDFITIANIITGEPNDRVGNFITWPRWIKWNGDHILTFNRKSNGNMYPFDLYSHYKTTLTSNVLIVLGGFECSAIVIADGFGGHDLDWDLSVPLKITEISGSDSENIKVISQMTAKLGSTMTNILLPQPILIRPGFLYSILFGPFPCEHQYRTQLLKKKMRFAPNIIIEVVDGLDHGDDDDDDDYDDDDDDGDAFGLISEFHFNTI